MSKIASLPVSQWRYKIENQEARHIGPLAEDFRETFNLGDGKTISTVDASGVALAAIKGLVEQLEIKEAELVDLKARLHEQEERMAQFEMALSELNRSQDGNIQMSSLN